MFGLSFPSIFPSAIGNIGSQTASFQPSILDALRNATNAVQVTTPPPADVGSSDNRINPVTPRLPIEGPSNMGRTEMPISDSTAQKQDRTQNEYNYDNNPKPDDDQTKKYLMYGGIALIAVVLITSN